MRIKTNEKYSSIVLKNMYENVSDDINLSAILNRVYAEKLSSEIVNTKVNNQLNSMEISIVRINPKYNEKSKKYIKMREQLEDTLKQYENVLRQLCDYYDQKIEELILKKVELESNLVIEKINKVQIKQNEKINTNNKNIVKGINTVLKKIKGKIVKKDQVDVDLSDNLQNENDTDTEKENLNASDDFLKRQKNIENMKKKIIIINKNIEKLNEEKKLKVFDVLEVGGKSLSTEIKKPKTFKKITKFFVNRFNTYNVIVKTIIEPLNQRIDEFKVNELKKINVQKEEFDLSQFQKKVDSNKKGVVFDENNKMIYEEK